jgi:hypothetical protein
VAAGFQPVGYIARRKLESLLDVFIT